MAQTLEYIETDAFEKIDNLNFSMLKMKLKHGDEGESWSNEKCDEVEYKYKMFLKLIYLYPELQIVPDIDIDKFWHYHILDTRNYLKDTTEVFGYFVHHYPYFGLKGDNDLKKLNQCFDETRRLFLEHFAYDLGNKNSVCSDEGSGDSSTCASRCRY